jgi:hypothetical protein
MSEIEIDSKIETLTDQELEILEQGISYHASLILLKLWPTCEVIKELVDRKRY